MGATVWTGGHIVLSLAVLPRVLKENSPERLLEFESAFERIGKPAMLVQIITGLLLAHRLLPDVYLWLDWSNPVSRVVGMKLMLLALTILLAADAKLRVLPKLSNKNLWDMAAHIIAVTLLSVLFVIVGVSFKTGWLY
ncbi:copper resistance protein CopD [Alteromonas sp. McT4-15]|uniref:copper resistance protein CopD n=1 Tax=Alteromonadaceae TaxID=72275 RepID=UPI001CF900D5|nr:MULTISPECIES: copper resistance protein CopD [Alteromonadaceae]MCB4434788.1 copper resistance protein CopD [Alteromonas sp. McT4-15]MCP9477078.1 copper resistance protein CopD [Marisediminitalea aggregata]